MTKELPRTVYLVELDALLDTRAAILFNNTSDEEFEAILKGNYFNRHVDDYPTIPFEKFRDMYRKRDKSILKDALATPLFKMVKDFAYAVMYNVIKSPHHLKPIVMVNTYPYKLTDEEQAIIHQSVVAKISNICPVEMINIAYKDITPRFIKANDIAYLAIYDYVEYLNSHEDLGDYKEIGVPETGLVCPAMIFSRPDPSSNPIIGNMFQAVEELLGPYISINYLPVEDFSISIDKKLLK